MGRGYGDFKKDLGEVVVEAVTPIQKRIDEILKDKPSLIKILDEGAKKAREMAQPKVAEFRKHLGLGH